MLLLEVTDDTRSGHRSGHEGSAHEPNFTRAVRCMFYGPFFISNSMLLVIRQSGTVEVISWWRSGQCQVKKGQISKLIFLHKMGIDSMQLVTASLVVVFVLRHVV